MARKYIDCRDFPSETRCSVAISADSETELLEIAIQHAVAVHGHKDTPDTRNQLRKLIKDGNPPETVHAELIESSRSLIANVGP